VIERTQQSRVANSTRLLLQLEFIGFSRLGSNPLKVLKANVPRYQYLNEQSVTPSRFTNYD
jgi:LPS-assembly protein